MGRTAATATEISTRTCTDSVDSAGQFSSPPIQAALRAVIILVCFILMKHHCSDFCRI